MKLNWVKNDLLTFRMAEFSKFHWPCTTSYDRAVLHHCIHLDRRRRIRPAMGSITRVGQRVEHEFKLEKGEDPFFLSQFIGEPTSDSPLRDRLRRSTLLQSSRGAVSQ